MNPEELKAALEAAGFGIYTDNLRASYNRCDWYASRRLSGVRECECNEHKVQLFIWPTDMVLGEHLAQSVTIEIVGGADGNWYKLQSYSIPMVECIDKLPAVETALVKAWNALI